MSVHTPASSEFTTKRRQWLDVLGGKDEHSIGNQLAQVAWDEASFAVINEARRLADPDSHGGVKLNGLIHDLLDRGFFTVQLLAVRRLNDNYCLEGKNATWSLTGLLDDMENHHELFKRKAIFETEGLEYDLQTAKNKLDEWHKSAPRIQGSHSVARILPRNLDYHRVLMRHQDFSQLAGITSPVITPEDTLKPDVFVNLKKKVNANCGNAIIYVNKFLAHAAAPGDRMAIDPQVTNVTLASLRDACKSLCQIASFLSTFILGDAHPHFLPIPQYDILEHIEKPFAKLSERHVLKDKWDNYEMDWHNWSSWGVDEYTKEFSGK